MTRFRRGLLASSDGPTLGEQVRRGALAAGGLCGVLGLLSIAPVVLGALLLGAFLAT